MVIFAWLIACLLIISNNVDVDNIFDLLTKMCPFDYTAVVGVGRWARKPG